MKYALLVLAFTLLSFNLHAQSAPSQPSTTVSTAPAKDPGPPMDVDLRAQMRDNQWAQAKNALEMQNIQSRYQYLQEQNSELGNKLNSLADQALDKAKLDKKSWHVNYDTMHFEENTPPAPAPSK